MRFRKGAAVLEKHDAIFESVESMGMRVSDFIGVAIEKTYEYLKETYLLKLLALRNRRSE